MRRRQLQSRAALHSGRRSLCDNESTLDDINATQPRAAPSAIIVRRTHLATERDTNRMRADGRRTAATRLASSVKRGHMRPTARRIVTRRVEQNRAISGVVEVESDSSAARPASPSTGGSHLRDNRTRAGGEGGTEVDQSAQCDDQGGAAGGDGCVSREPGRRPFASWGTLLYILPEH